jgi:hypothetical protein
MIFAFVFEFGDEFALLGDENLSTGRVAVDTLEVPFDNIGGLPGIECGKDNPASNKKDRNDEQGVF